jgi:hypothetical protein
MVRDLNVNVAIVRGIFHGHEDSAGLGPGVISYKVVCDAATSAVKA